MTNASPSAVTTEATTHNTVRLSLSVKFVGMAPDEELLGLVKAFFASRGGRSSVSIERLPCRRRFRARVGANGEAFEHEDPRLALGAAFSRLSHPYANHIPSA